MKTLFPRALSLCTSFNGKESDMGNEMRIIYGIRGEMFHLQINFPPSLVNRVEAISSIKCIRVNEERRKMIFYVCARRNKSSFPI